MKKTVTLFLLAVLLLGSSQAQRSIRPPKAVRAARAARAARDVRLATIIGHGIIQQRDRIDRYGNIYYPPSGKYKGLLVDPIPNGSSDLHLPKSLVGPIPNGSSYLHLPYTRLSVKDNEMFSEYDPSSLPSFSKNCEGFSLTLESSQAQVDPSMEKHLKASMFKSFIKYASIRSQSVYDANRDTFIVTEGQRLVARKVYEDLDSIPGVEVKMSPDFYVYARIPSNLRGKKSVPSVCFMSHLDITPEVPDPTDSLWVMPKVHFSYDGGDIELGYGVTISPNKPEGQLLKDKLGHTIVTGDGRTLLGGDCKAGVSIMVELARFLSLNPSIKHGDIYLYFTQNEEVGMAAERFVPNYLGKTPDMIFDIDGHDPESFAMGNFTAVNGTLVFKGNMNHPSDGYYSGFADASTAASYWIGQIPPSAHPSFSKDREGYFQVFQREMFGRGNERLYFRMRYFDKADSTKYGQYFDTATQRTKSAYPRVEIELESRYLPYDNVANSLHPKTQEVLQRAGEKMGMSMSPRYERAGTTCAMLVSKGINGGPCIFGGQHAIHSVYEWVSIEELVKTMFFCAQVTEEVANLKAE